MSYPIALLTRMSDQELLVALDDKRPHSPILNLLLERIEAGLGVQVMANANHRVECPVCMAQLEVDYDEGNTLFNLRIDRS